VQVFDSGEEAGLPFFVMEYAPYGSLARRHPLGERLPSSIRAMVPEIPAAVERVVLTALQKTPNHRFRTMLDFTLAFEEACRPVIVRLPYYTPVSRSHRMVASHRQEYTSRYGAALRQQQPMPAAQRNVLVAHPSPHPAPLHQRHVQEESWEPVPSSDGDEKNVVLLSRLQVVWSRVCNVWQRVAGFLVRKLRKR
jgi:hypothetical protein